MGFWSTLKKIAIAAAAGSAEALLTKGSTKAMGRTAITGAVTGAIGAGLDEAKKQQPESGPPEDLPRDWPARPMPLPRSQRPAPIRPDQLAE